MTRILLVEDEMRAAKRMMRLLEEHFPEEFSITHHQDIHEGIAWLKDNEIDLLLLDLNLNGESGFDVLKNTVAESFQTIICSAYTDKAIEAFEHGVLDFIPKPLMASRLKQGLDRYFGTRGPEHEMQLLAVKRAGEIKMLPLERVDFIKAAGHYSELHVDTGKSVLHDKSLEKLERLLPIHFRRIHKSFIANLNSIEKLKSYPGSKYEAKMRNGETLPIGRHRYKELKQALL
ncbi:MAG: LytR/AlgR family response regulator transcription factor [Calditrichia bacterium]